MRTKRLTWNTITSLSNQVITILCGFILPRLILTAYGSQVNGLVASITQFLSVIAFMELGVGAVVQSALYKPLAEKDNAEISKVILSAEHFFRRLAGLLVVYVVGLILLYPWIVREQFGFFDVAFLIFAMSISSFTQYYFGLVNQLLLDADQRIYIVQMTQAVTLILNTAVCSVMILAGGSIFLVKLTTSLIFLLRPLFLYEYVRRHYAIDRKITYEGEPIRQKWNGLAQHIAAVVLDNTDTIVLTLFSTLSAVSVYAVYHLVIYGVKQLFMSLTNGVQSLLGELWAKQQMDELQKAFSWAEWCIHSGTAFFFGCTGMLILPFVQVYTRDIQDANYQVPLFAALIVLAHAGHCLRLPYNIMVLAAGHYKQTQSNYIVAAVLNITISVLTVKLWGLVGVAIGTLTAMAYQTIWLSWYNAKHLLHWPMKNVLRQLAVDALYVLLSVALTYRLHLTKVSYLGWGMLAIKTALIWALTFVAVNYLFYRQKLFGFRNIVLRKLRKNRG